MDANTVDALHAAIKKHNEIVSAYRDTVRKKLQNIYTPIIQPALGLAESVEAVNRMLQVLESVRCAYMKSIEQSSHIKNDLLLLNKKIAHLFCIEEYNAYKKQINETQNMEKAYQIQTESVRKAQQELDALLQRKMSLKLAIECINESLAYRP